MGFIIYRENENLRSRHISSFRQKKLVGKKNDSFYQWRIYGRGREFTPSPEIMVDMIPV